MVKKILLSSLAAFFLSACGEYELQEAPEKSLKEKVSLVRSNDGTQVYVYHQLPELELYTLTDSMTIKNRVEHKDSALSIYPNHIPTMLKAISQGDTFLVCERYIKVKGIHNLRDVGGLFTKKGYQMKWGMLFRADKLSDIEEGDEERLLPLHISTIVDFRSQWEAEEEPDKWPNYEEIRYVHLPIGGSTLKRDELMEKIKEPEFDAEQFMIDANRSFIESSSNQYRQFFELLLDESTYPILFHCSAGKDRTGLATALILSALGIEKQIIMDEYLMSNYYLHESKEKRLEQAAMFLGVNHTHLRPLMEVKVEYLEAAFQAIEEIYGSVDQYLSEALNIGPEEKERLRELLLYQYLQKGNPLS